MLPRDNRRQPGGRGGRGVKPERSSSRQSVQPARASGNAPVMGTVIGFAPPAATVPAINERFAFAFQVLIGYTVEVQVSITDPNPTLCCAAGVSSVLSCDRPTVEKASVYGRLKLVVSTRGSFTQLSLKIRTCMWFCTWPSW